MQEEAQIQTKKLLLNNMMLIIYISDDLAIINKEHIYIQIK